MNAAALLASKAYGAAASGLTPGNSNGPSVADAGLNFGNLLAQQVSSTIEASRAAETQGAAAAVGRAELVDVVTAVAAAEVQMETMIAFRDQAIQAYQEIMRMPI
jgi:flagellar hook-basal body complex protein FliE